MLKRIDLHPDKTKYKNFSFSSCIIAGDYIFTSHQGGALSDDGTFLPTIEEQTEQSFRNLERTLGEAGVTLDDVVKIMIYMKNADDFQAIEDIYTTKFKNGFPVRSAVITGFVSEGILIQMDAIAYKPR